jgi:3-hydroxybutyryl-CoA dehydrogenase
MAGESSFGEGGTLDFEVGLLGGGFMGGGIAESVARAGYEVRLYEPIGDARVASAQRLRKSVGRAVAAGKLSDEEGEALIDRVRYLEDPHELADCGLGISR